MLAPVTGPEGPMAAAALLLLEGTALSVSSALTARGVEHILLKGPVSSLWLYGALGARRYSDVDLLVAPGTWARTEVVLRDLGFEDEHRRVLGAYRPDNERTWSRDGVAVDLHHRLALVPARLGERAFSLLYEDSVVFSLHGREVRALSVPARCVHLALHVCQSARDDRAERELLLGLAVASHGEWRAAVALSRELEVSDVLSAALDRVAALATHPALENIDLVRAEVGHVSAPRSVSLRQSTYAAELLAIDALLRTSATGPTPRPGLTGMWRRDPTGQPLGQAIRDRLRLAQRLLAAAPRYAVLSRHHRSTRAASSGNST